MRKIEAIIRPEKLDAVKLALEEKGVIGLTVTEVKGRGRQKGIVQQWRGREYRVDMLSKIKIEIVLDSSKTEDILKTIVDVAKTGKEGDGMIFIHPIEDVVRVRTGERGKKAL